ncbi:hypothetical protein LBMAG42_05250 [Deltaproteobacteria bacterium]|nr:hypothetical protein LBMAG42_05250 [Deltaproteobacteria bacterium]
MRPIALPPRGGAVDRSTTYPTMTFDAEMLELGDVALDGAVTATVMLSNEGSHVEDGARIRI